MSDSVKIFPCFCRGWQGASGWVTWIGLGPISPPFWCAMLWSLYLPSADIPLSEQRVQRSVGPSVRPSAPRKHVPHSHSPKRYWGGANSDAIVLIILHVFASIGIQAIEAYTKALEVDPGNRRVNSVLYCNRAAAYKEEVLRHLVATDCAQTAGVHECTWGI